MPWCYSKSNEHAPRGLVLLCPVISDFLWWGIFKYHPPLFYYEVFHIFKTVYSIYIYMTDILPVLILGVAFDLWPVVTPSGPG